MNEPRRQKSPGLLRFMFDSFLHEPVYPALMFALEWHHDAHADEWVLRRRNARGAVSSIGCICGLGGTVIGGLMLGWMKVDEAVFYGFGGMILVLVPFAIYRLGSSTRLILRGDAEIEWETRLFGVCLSSSTVPLNRAWVTRGMVRFFRPSTPELDGVWIGSDWRGIPSSLVLARGKHDGVEAYIKRLPPALAASIQQSNRPHMTRFGPIF